MKKLIIIWLLAAQASFAYATTQNSLNENEKALQKMRQDLEHLNRSNVILRSQMNLLLEKLQIQEALLNANCGNDLPDNCFDAAKETNKSGIYKIELKNFNRLPFYVFCNTEVQKGGWLIVMRRQDGSINFDKTWDEYKNGFGNLNGEYFIGLDKLHDLTKNSKQEILFIMEDYYDVRRYAKYDAFVIEAEADGYAMSKLGQYTGDAGDSFTNHTGFKFTTKDKQNDVSEKNCAKTFTGGWWYNDCHLSHLTGTYGNDVRNRRYWAQGITWQTFRGDQKGMKFAEMMIRPRIEQKPYVPKNQVKCE